jgi:hypothetical protein
LLVFKSSNTTFTIDKQKQQQQTWEMCAIPHGHGAGFSPFLATLLQQRRPERERRRRRKKKTTKQMQKKA